MDPVDVWLWSRRAYRWEQRLRIVVSCSVSVLSDLLSR